MSIGPLTRMKKGQRGKRMSFQLGEDILTQTGSCPKVLSMKKPNQHMPITTEVKEENETYNSEKYKWPNLVGISGYLI